MYLRLQTAYRYLQRIEYFEVKLGTLFSEYLTNYHTFITDVMTCNPVYLPAVICVVAAVRANIYRYFHTVNVELFTGESMNNRFFTSLPHLWRHLERCLYTNALAAPSPTQNGRVNHPNSRGFSSVHVVKGPAQSKDPLTGNVNSWPADDGLFLLCGLSPHKPLVVTCLLYFSWSRMQMNVGASFHTAGNTA